ncbi:DUF460 domain-containing protein [Candidatus Micrarchaeota archaeon]|nr:DUF460 domain-containing protein [Candidatus Micrarchaeota archaeon]
MFALIIGVDAGATTAVAAIDFDRRLVSLRSKRNWDQGQLVKHVSSFSPSLIACDTNPPQKAVSSLKACLPARLYYPLKSLTIKEKAELTREFKFKNRHERDALASALRAYHFIENKLRQVEKHFEGDSSRIKRLVLSGKKMSDAANL